MVNENELWIHQESALITAEFHEVWRFTPEFLREEEIVSDLWACHRATRSSDEINIQYGPSHWSMTQNELWITEYPDKSLPIDTETASGDGEEDQTNIPVLAYNFLATMPSLPSRRLWFFWRISVINTDRTQWMLENFLNRKWPPEMGTIRLRPHLYVYLNDLLLDITIRNQTYQRRGENAPASTTFDCFVSSRRDMVVGDMLKETGNRSEWLRLLSKTILQLLRNEESNVANHSK